MSGIRQRKVSSKSRVSLLQGRRRFFSRRRVVFALAIIFGLAAFIGWGWRRYQQRLRLLEKVKLAVANPDGLAPGKFLSRIDDGFDSLPEDDQQRILSNPDLLAEHIRQASYNNYKAAFGDLFKLPAPVRGRLIQNAARSVTAAVEKNPERVDAFYESEAGKAALRAASEYFFIELSGKEKAELKPLTDAFFKIQSRKGRTGH